MKGLLACALGCLLSACSVTRPVTQPALDAKQPAPPAPSAAYSYYEAEDLVGVRHNAENEYTLMIYRNTAGELRYVLRQQGICQMILTHTDEGDVRLKERGRPERPIEMEEAALLIRRIESLVDLAPEPPPAQPVTDI